MTRRAITSFFADLIDHDAAADGPPPEQLWAFSRWCLAGSFGVLRFAMAASLTLGILEVTVMAMLGFIVDAAVEAENSNGFWADNWPLLIIWVLLFVVARPLAAGVANSIQSLAIGPNLFKLVLSRLHRHTLGQSVDFFDNDFAGRISQKQMQTSRALVDVVVDIVAAMTSAASTLIASVLFIGSVDVRLTVIVAVWLACYYFFLRAFLPQIRRLSARRAAARASVTGQIVDTITNIKTVKLFASSDHEDEAALDALGQFRERALDWGETSVLFRVLLVFIAGTLPTVVVTFTLFLISTGSASVGQLAATGAMAVRLSQMTGFVSFTFMNIYGNIGEIEDGMKTLAPPHTLVDATEAAPLANRPTVSF